MLSQLSYVPMTDRGYYNPCGRKMQANFLHGERIDTMFAVVLY